MRIGIVPKITEPFKNQYECTVDIKLINFLKKIFKKSEILILNQATNIKKMDFLILHGGNDLVCFNENMKNVIRQRHNNYYFNLAQRNKIPTLGICLGAQFIAKRYGAVLIKKKHIGKHKILFSNIKFFKNIKLSSTTNSYHNYVIKKLDKKFINLVFARDKSIEAFVNFNKKILGIMWHPERFSKFRKFDKQMIKKFYDISNTGRRTGK